MSQNLLLDSPLWSQGYIDNVSFKIRHEGEHLMVSPSPGRFGIAKSDTSLFDIYHIQADTDENGNVIELKRGELLTSFDNDKSLIALTKLTFKHIEELLDNDELNDDYFYRWLKYDHGGAITKLPMIRDKELYSKYFFNEDHYLFSEKRDQRWGANISDAFKTEEGFRWANLLKIAVKARLKNDVQALTKAIDSNGLLSCYEALTTIKKQTQTTRDIAEIRDEKTHLSQDSLIDRWAGILSSIFSSQQTRVLFKGIRLAWLDTIINSVWLGDVSLRINRSITGPNHSLKIATGLRSMDYEPTLDHEGHYLGEFDIKRSQYSPGGVVDFTPLLIDAEEVTTMIQSHTKIMKSASKGFTIDIIKYLYKLWETNPEVRSTNRITFYGGFSELAKVLAKEYEGTKFVDRGKVKDALIFLNAYATGRPDSSQGYKKFITFNHDPNGGKLTIFFHDLITEHNKRRLVPLINHPRGKGRSIELYSFLGLALSLWFTDHSIEYSKAPDKGVLFSEDLINYLLETVRYSRKDKLMEHIEVFTEAKAIEVIDNTWIKLGINNRKEEALIIEGAKKQIEGSKRGLLSAHQSRQKLLSKK